MKKIFIYFVLFCSFFSLNTFALSNENIINYTLKYEQIFSTKYDFSQVNQNLLNNVISKINNYVNQIYSQELKYDSSEAEIVLGQLLWLKKTLQKYIINVDTSKLTVTIIDDKRCTNCRVDELEKNLKNTLYFKWASFETKDFSEIWISEYLKSNSIKYLPVVLLSNDKFTDNISILAGLKKLNDWKFLYDIWWSFDPFKLVSDRGYFILDSETLNNLKSWAYMSWKLDAKISWIKFSDLACPYCKLFYNSNLASNLNITYGDEINSYFLHFPLDIHPTAYEASLLTECFWEQKTAAWFFDLVWKIYKDWNSTKEFIINSAVSLWADKTKLEQCLTNWTYKSKIKNQIDLWINLFWVSGTPTSIFINNETWEYEIMLWMYEYDKITSMINNLMK